MTDSVRGMAQMVTLAIDGQGGQWCGHQMAEGTTKDHPELAFGKFREGRGGRAVAVGSVVAKGGQWPRQRPWSGVDQSMVKMATLTIDWSRRGEGWPPNGRGHDLTDGQAAGHGIFRDGIRWSTNCRLYTKQLI